MQIALTYVPCPNLEEAKDLCRKAIEKKYSLCGNILPGITSIYVWEGKLEESTEHLLLIKHKKSDFPLLRKFLEENHSYDIPCITQIELHETNELYSQWFKNGLK